MFRNGEYIYDMKYKASQIEEQIVQIINLQIVQMVQFKSPIILRNYIALFHILFDTCDLRKKSSAGVHDYINSEHPFECQLKRDNILGQIVICLQFAA